MDKIDYRRKVKKIDDFSQIKQSEVNKIHNLVNQKKHNSNFQLKYILPFAILIFLFVLLPQLFLNNSSNILKLTKVSAQEYVIENAQYKIRFKSFVVSENQAIQEGDFSYYKEMSRYTDHSSVIGTEVGIDLKVYQINNRNFASIQVNGQVSYYEFIMPYMIIKKLEQLELEDFRNDMTDILSLVDQYPPIYNYYDDHLKIDKYRYNPDVEELGNNRIIENYKSYVNHYYYPTKNTHTKTQILTGVYFLIILDENKEVKETTLSSSYNYFNELYNPNEIFSIELIDPSTYYGSISSPFSNDTLNGQLNIVHIKESTNTLYQNQTLAYLFINVDQLISEGRQIKEIRLKDLKENKEYIFDHLKTHNHYQFTLPIIITNNDNIYQGIELKFIDDEGSSITIEIPIHLGL